MSTNLQDYVELLNAEQHVQVNKLRDHARHGIAAGVRGEVWMYLLDVIGSDKTNEITTVLDLNTQYQSIPSNQTPTALTTLITKKGLAHHTRRFFNPTYAGLITSITAETKSIHGDAAEDVHSRQQSHPGGDGPAKVLAAEAKSSQMTNNLLDGSRRQDSSDGAPFTTLRSRYSKFLPPPPKTAPSRHDYIAMLKEVLGKYSHSRMIKNELARQQNRAGYPDAEVRVGGVGLGAEDEHWVELVTPFICCLKQPIAIYLGFEKLMQRIAAFPPLPSRLASLLTLFRLALPELFSYFEDEQVPYVNVALSWLTTLLAKEMWLGDILRLWDAYLASDDMFALHCYVCVAILSTCKETLEELDASEAKLMLLDLPPLDVDRLLQDAANLRVTYPLPRPVEEDELP